MIITSKIKRISITHEVILIKKGTSFSYLVETTKNNEILKININHNYILKYRTRKEFMALIREYFTKTK